MDGSSSFHGFQAAAAAAAASSTAAGTNGSDQCCTVREQDRLMPIANVIRIMRRVLPPHAKISDDAKETIQECVSEFIGFVTGEANDRCQREQRKTITAEDVLWAMNKLGFDDYVDPLTGFLRRYREAEGDRRGLVRGDPLPLTRRSAAAAAAEMVPPLGGAAVTGGNIGSSGDASYGFHRAYPADSYGNYYHHHHHRHHHALAGHVMGAAVPPGYYFGMHNNIAAADGDGTNGGGGGGGGATSTRHQTVATDPFNDKL